jgi:hypothetical protein
VSTGAIGRPPAAICGHGEKLSRRWEAAITGLLLHATLAEAAESAGVSERSLRRWLQDANFRAEYRCARQRLLDGASNLLRSKAVGAVEVLWQLANDPSTKGSTRVSAAKAILLCAFHAAELEEMEAIEQRLLALEKRQSCLQR